MRSDRNVADAVEEGEEQGKPDQRNDVGDGRREHQAAESLLVVRQPAEESGVRRARREISRGLLQRFAQNRRGSVRRPVALSKNLMSCSLMANSYTPPATTGKWTVKGRFTITRSFGNVSWSVP